MFHFHISLIKALDVILHFKFCAPCSFFSILQNNYFTHTHIYKSTSTLDPTDNDSATVSYDFESPINQAKDEGEDDCEVPEELARLLLQEERAIQLTKTTNNDAFSGRKTVDLILDSTRQFSGVRAGAA